jgi:uncharacterized membrane protein YeaQ/YmgE (transglycosylase-associated protein family)
MAFITATLRSKMFTEPSGPNAIKKVKRRFVAAPTEGVDMNRLFHKASTLMVSGYINLRRITMLFIIWIVVGGILGWLASLVMKTDAEQGMILNVVVGIIGAFLGGWLLSPLFGTGTINSNDFSVTSLLVSFLGAVILLAIVNLFRRGRTR